MIQKPTYKDKVFLLLGSNMGDRLANLEKTQEGLGKSTSIVGTSSVYETEAWGLTNQAPFLNQVLQIRTELTSRELLILIQEVEKQAGRVRFEKWGPRIIDIDILFIEDEIHTESDLKIPHPEIQNRRFTLVPLAELAPNFKHPVLNINMIQMLSFCKDDLTVKKIKTQNI